MNICQKDDMIYLNGAPLNVTLFPDNTSQVWKLDSNIFKYDEVKNILWEFSHEGEFLQLAQLKNLLDHKDKRSRLTIKYLPYGRQDKMVSNEATFALRTFARLLNSLNFKEITIVDPHSQIALNIIHNSVAEYPKRIIEELIHRGYCTLACYPDNGARTKYTEVYKEIIGTAHVYGEKVRDQLTGNITHYELIGGERVKGEKILIIDDICDGGMTFKILAKDLLAAGAAEVNLFVTHGIFSKGLRTLKESGIKNVFTQDGEVSEFQDQLAYKKL